MVLDMIWGLVWTLITPQKDRRRRTMLKRCWDWSLAGWGTNYYQVLSEYWYFTLDRSTVCKCTVLKGGELLSCGIVPTVPRSRASEHVRSPFFPLFSFTSLLYLFDICSLCRCLPSCSVVPAVCVWQAGWCPCKAARVSRSWPPAGWAVLWDKHSSVSQSQLTDWMSVLHRERERERGIKAGVKTCKPYIVCSEQKLLISRKEKKKWGKT